ncbi:MAG: glycosyltransferase [Myxococcales bacterium]|nr:glycosyltransferase [Myxococcales bacterium]
MNVSPSPAPLVSIIVPVFNLWEYTLRCLLSVVRHTSHIPHEVIVIDDASTDETAAALPLLEGVRFHRNDVNQGFSHNNNIAAQMARGQYLVFLNNDTEVHPRWLDKMLDVMKSDPSVGMVGCKLLFPDGTIQHGGVGFSYGSPDPISPYHLDYQKPSATSTERRSLQAVTAACALMPRSLFVSLGGFDEGFRMGYEDVDLCLRIREAGWKIIYTPDSLVTHYESLSPGRFESGRRNIERLHENWLGRFEAYDADYRKVIPPRSGLRRQPCSVVVSVHDELSAVAPALHSLTCAMAPDDELILVDDGSVGATSKFLRLFADRQTVPTRVLRHETHRGLARAWTSGLAVATYERAVACTCTVCVLPDAVDRLMRHLEADPQIGLLGTRTADGTHYEGRWRLYMEGVDPGRVPRVGAGAAPSSTHLTTALVAGPTAGLRRLVEEMPHGVPGQHPKLWTTALREEGRRSAVAPDVEAFPLTQVFPACNEATRSLYFEHVAAALDGGLPGEKVSVIVVARDHEDALWACLSALVAHTQKAMELIIVDDGSSTPLRVRAEQRLATLRTRAFVSTSWIRNEGPMGLPFAINQGLAHSTAAELVVMNGDVLVTPQWLVRMSAVLRLSPDIGIVAPTANTGPRPQRCDMPNALHPPMELDDFAAERRAKYLGEFGGMPRVSGVCLLLRRELVDAIGGFDPSYPQDGDVEDYCLRATRRGFLVAMAREAYVEHLGRLPARWLDLHPRRAHPRGWLRFCERWHHDPADSDTDGLSKVFAPEPGFNPATDRVTLPTTPSGVASRTNHPIHVEAPAPVGSHSPRSGVQSSSRQT